MPHTPVLLKEAIDGLAFEPGQIFLDATVGNGGHSKEVCRRYGSGIKIIGLDLDGDAIGEAKKELSSCGSNATLVLESFRNLDKVLANLSIKKIDRALFDLGMSSDELERSGRGFSFNRDEPLLMTFRNPLPPNQITGKEIVNDWDEKNLATIIFSYGEERFAKRIARAIVKRRGPNPIGTTRELATIVKEAVPSWYRHRKTNPATKTFQAIRIAVNDELGALTEGLKKAFDALSTEGRISVITFHSLEDRIVKRYFLNLVKSAKGSTPFKKPIIPSRDEIAENPRGRSAKLRMIIKKFKK